MASQCIRLSVGRALIGLVLLSNAQCALAFLAQPQAYAGGFELSTDVAGLLMVRATGLLFLMWCVPYVVACWHPVRHRVALWEAIAMQAIGLLGETLLLALLPRGHEVLRATGRRFLLFDGAGLALLLAAVAIVRRSRPRPSRSSDSLPL